MMQRCGCTYRCHEDSKKTAHAESHHARYRGFAKARLHHGVYLEAGLAKALMRTVERGVTNRLDVRVIGIVCSPAGGADSSW